MAEGRRTTADPPQEAGPGRKLEWEEFRRRVWLAAGVAVLVVGAGLVLVFAARVFLLAFAGIMLAVFLGGLAYYLRRWTGVPQRAALLTVVFLLLALLIVGGWYTFPWLAGQIDTLLQQFPRSAERIEQLLGQYEFGRYLIRNAPRVQSWMIGGGQILSQAGLVVWSTTGLLVDLIVIFFIGVYLAWGPEVYVRGLVRLFPGESRERAGEILGRVGDTLWRWLLGRLVSMGVIFVCTAVGFLAIGLPGAVPLALFAALMAFIPNFGPVLGIIPAVLIAFSQGPGQVLWVIGLYALIQTAESYLLMPVVQYRMVRLPPAVIIFAQVLLGVLFGALGVLFATPLAAAVLVVVKDLYVKDEDAQERAKGGGGAD